MNTITKEELAARLNGREYGDEMTKEEEQLAKNSGLLVAFGYSDDNVEFRGIFHDEVGAYNKTSIRLDAKGVLPTWDNVRENEDAALDYLRRKYSAKIIVATFGDKGWDYSTSIPNAGFSIMKYEQIYGMGMVIDGKDL